MADSGARTAPDAKKEYARAWRRANPDKVREYQRRYWQRKADEYNAQHFLPDHLVNVMSQAKKESAKSCVIRLGCLWRRVHKIKRYAGNRSQFDQDIADLEKRGFIKIVNSREGKPGRPTKDVVILMEV